MALVLRMQDQYLTRAVVSVLAKAVAHEGQGLTLGELHERAKIGIDKGQLHAYLERLEIEGYVERREPGSASVNVYYPGPLASESVKALMREKEMKEKGITPMSLLHEYLRRGGSKLPLYNSVAKSNGKLWEVIVHVNGKSYAPVEAERKKDAEQMAARLVCEELGLLPRQ